MVWSHFGYDMAAKIVEGFVGWDKQFAIQILGLDIPAFDLIIILWPWTKAFGGVIWWTSEEVGYAWGEVLGKEVCIGEMLGEVSCKKIYIGEMLDSRLYVGERYADEASVAVATIVGDWE